MHRSARVDRFASRIRAAARATGVASIFALSAMAGFGTEPPASRPVQIADNFTPRPYAMSYAVREAVAKARANSQFAGVVEALEARREPAAAPASVSVPVVAYGETGADDRARALGRFDAFVAGTLALDASADIPAPPVPTMRPIMPPVIRTVGPGASRP